MTRRQQEPLRAISDEERQELERISRATSESAARVTRAKALLGLPKDRAIPLLPKLVEGDLERR